MEYLRLQGVLIQLWVFGLGLVIGSFLNVCICRIPEKISLLWPASRCVNCSKRIAWYDNIPVLSYLFLRGKCRHCQHKISAVYPITEIITGIVFLSLFHSVIVVKGDLICAYIFYLIFCCLLIVGSIVDLKLYIIPNEITYTGLVLAPIASLLCTGSRNLNSAQGYFDNSANQWMVSLHASVIGIFIAGGMIFLCGVIGKLVLRKDAMGFGDVKLMGVIGGFIGWKLAVATFFLAPFFGLLFGIPRLISKKGKVIPYGPFLSLAAFICLLFQDATVGIIDNYLDVYVTLFLYLF
ncbi:MAG: prepilin peptidase [Candidatus Scalindua sp.]|nr:prepilin peptidase [Candidatus Scalindua sp.]MCR4344915.1 prepilin peptidase [Candidatus Scalindua sp.]